MLKTTSTPLGTSAENFLSEQKPVPFPSWVGSPSLEAAVRVLAGLAQPAQRTVRTSRMQKRARQVGQGTRLASQVSGRCWSWRLANHLPMQVRHHMGRQ